MEIEKYISRDFEKFCDEDRNHKYCKRTQKNILENIQTTTFSEKFIDDYITFLTNWSDVTYDFCMAKAENYKEALFELLKFASLSCKSLDKIIFSNINEHDLKEIFLTIKKYNYEIPELLIMNCFKNGESHGYRKAAEIFSDMEYTNISEEHLLWATTNNNEVTAINILNRKIMPTSLI